MTDDNPVTLRDCILGAVADLDDHLDQGDDPWNGDEHAMIHELADNAVPVYNADILRITAEEPEIAHTAPDYAAFDGTFTPVNVAAANIYEAIQTALWERLEERKIEQAA